MGNLGNTGGRLRIMLKHIEPSCYDEEKYKQQKEMYFSDYDRICRQNGEPEPPDKTVRGTLMTFYPEDFDEETMDKFIMLVSGMLWAIKHGGVADDDPESLAYNVWDALKDFSTGNYDDLFTPEDLVLIKKDVATLYDYFDKHPALKGD